jgi:phosphoglycerate dehydrogenase-like enzyme
VSREAVIACGLGEFIETRIASHPSTPKVIAMDTSRPWDPPGSANVMMTYMSSWKNAPAERPDSWPGNIRWVHAGSAGVDGFPKWFFEAPAVTCSRGVLSPAVAEYVLAAILAHEKKLWAGSVHRPQDWVPSAFGGLAGKTLGIAGFGTIGKEIANRARAFDVNILALTRTSAVSVGGVTSAHSLEELVATSDHLVLCLPLTPETFHIIDDALLSKAKPGLHLINVARGGMIDNDAVLRALDAGQLAAATLDVTDPEPLPENHPFYSHPRVRLTPHVAGAAENSKDRLLDKILGNLDRFLSDEPLEDRVDSLRGY